MKAEERKFILSQNILGKGKTTMDKNGNTIENYDFKKTESYRLLMELRNEFLACFDIPVENLPQEKRQQIDKRKKRVTLAYLNEKF
jgi:hypothetical protein